MLDEQEWSLGEMLGALSELPTDAEGRDVRSKEHVRRMKEFLGKQARVGVQEDEVKGPEEVARLWTETEGDDGKGSSKSLVRVAHGGKRCVTDTSITTGNGCECAVPAYGRESRLGGSFAATSLGLR